MLTIINWLKIGLVTAESKLKLGLVHYYNTLQYEWHIIIPSYDGWKTKMKALLGT